MFHNIPESILKRMAYLEEIDTQDRLDGTPQLHRLRQVTPETGKFLALLAAGSPDGVVLEIGTSAGYSSLWLILACMDRDGQLTTFEIHPEKIHLARQTFTSANVETHVNLIQGDALEHISYYKQISFCFFDAEKDTYLDCYELVIPNLVRGGLLVADNVISHKEMLLPFVNRVYADPRVDALVVPIGKGVLLCRKTDI